MHTRSIPCVQLLSLFFLVSLALPSLGQTNKQFQWQFANSAIASSIPTCTTLPIIVKSFDPTTNATHGIPPYYMIAFAVGGTPQTSFIGTDENNLSWTVTQPVGSQLILSVVDSTGGAGGIPPLIFTVMPGQSTQCVIPPSTDPPFTVTANVTTELTTCQPWGLTVKGGNPPYVVTLVEVNSPIVTNVTMPNGLDRFTFIDRADPNAKLIAAISDLTGRWASGTPLVNTRGSSDVSCVGLVSSSGNAALIQQQLDAANASAQAAKRRKSTAVAVVVTLLLLLAVGAVGIVFFRLRKRKREDQAELAEAKPHQYVEPQMEVRMLSINNYLDPPKQNQNQPTSRKAAIIAELQNSQTRGNRVQENGLSSPLQGSPSSTTGLLSSTGAFFDRSGSGTPVLDSRSPSRMSNPGFAKFPATSIRQSGKLLQSNVLTTRSPESEYPSSGLPDGSATGEVIFQHQDGGVVRELPPPYADRLRRSQAPSS